ncbi:MAG: FAD-dependent oxidoreductase [Pseudomonadales bacterium]
MKPTYRIAIVGSGPSGMYALEHLLHNKQANVEIDLFERLPVPWGLVRYGVAPDHPEKKLISTRLYNNLISRRNVRFFGNVEIGKDISHPELAQWYDGVIYASGANADRKLNIPGEELPGSWSAREFVAWYNGHPDFSHLDFDLSTDRAVIVGNGNVALDVARILMLPVEELNKTDIASHAIAALSKSNIREVVILGRRGYQNGAYHNPELEEFSYLDDVAILVEDPDFSNVDVADLTHLDWETRRKVATLKKLSNRKIAGAGKRIIFSFLSSPLALKGDRRLEEVLINHNGAESDIAEQTNKDEIGATSNNKTSSITAGILFRSIGYRGTPFPELPFDQDNGVIENLKGRISNQGDAVTGAYVTGWIKRGARGVIGTNKQCAEETVSCLLDDLASASTSNSQALRSDLVLEQIKTKQPAFVSLESWLSIDRAEKEKGALRNQPRSKICSIEEMLEVARS